MEKRIFGIILTLLGLAGLIYAAATIVNDNNISDNLKSIAVYGILGFIFFFSGISLIRNTKDKAT